MIDPYSIWTNIVPQSLINITRKGVSVCVCSVGFVYACRVETLKTISRFEITVPETLGKGSKQSKQLNLPQSRAKCLPPQQSKAAERESAEQKQRLGK